MSTYPYTTMILCCNAQGVGTAAIQLIVAAGGTAIATVGSETKIAATKEFGAVAAFNRHDGPWSDNVIAASKDGKGVNLILVRVLFFDKKFTLEDAIEFHAFAPLEASSQASRRVTNGIPLGYSLFFPVHTVNCV
jgi:Zn-dependent alcohol dehydrogenase